MFRCSAVVLLQFSTLSFEINRSDISTFFKQEAVKRFEKVSLYKCVLDKPRCILEGPLSHSLFQLIRSPLYGRHCAQHKNTINDHQSRKAITNGHKLALKNIESVTHKKDERNERYNECDGKFHCVIKVRQKNGKHKTKM